MSDAKKKQEGAANGTQVEVIFLRAECLLTSPLEVLPPLEVLQREHPDWLVTHTISLDGVRRDEYCERYLAVSCRRDVAPDAAREHLTTMRKHLHKNQLVEFCFYPPSCLPPSALRCGIRNTRPLPASCAHALAPLPSTQAKRARLRTSRSSRPVG